MEEVRTTALHEILVNCSNLTEKPALRWLGSKCEVVDTYTYARLERRTQEIARGLLGLIQEESDPTKFRRGQRAVLYYSPGLDFILNFIACLRAGVIPVAVESAETLLDTVSDCGASFILTNKDFSKDPSILELGSKSIPVPLFFESGVVDVDGTASVTGEDAATTTAAVTKTYVNRLDKAQPEDIAFLQYTSGTNGKLKGVVVTFQNLLHNLKMMTERFSTSDSMVEVTFLPHSNSLCLVGSYLHTLYSGGSGYYMSNDTFFESPGILMKALSNYNATHAKVPNFTFEYVLMRVDYPRAMNLESVICITCLEPVCIDEVIKFESVMHQFDMEKNVICVGYGLTEHVAIVSSIKTGEERIVANNRMSCGRPPNDVIVKIVNTTSLKETSDGQIGEVWISSESKAGGYWEREDTSKEMFQKNLDGTYGITFLRTGELGFLQDGNLFICETMHDSICIEGISTYLTDIENVAKSVIPSVIPRKLIAIKDNPLANDITVVAELYSPHAHSLSKMEVYCTEMATQVTVECQVKVSTVIFTKPFALPFNVDGKPQRFVCKEKLRRKEIPVIFEWSSIKGTAVNVLPSPTQLTKERSKDMTSKLAITGMSVKPPDSPSSKQDKDGVSVKTRRISAPFPKDGREKVIPNSPRTRSEGTIVRKNNVKVLAEKISRFLGREIGPDENIWGDSSYSEKKMKQLSQRLTTEFGFSVDADILCENLTPRDLSDKVRMILLVGTANPTRPKDDWEGEKFPSLSENKTFIEITPTTNYPLRMGTPIDNKPSMCGNLSTIYESKCSIPLRKLQESYHLMEEIAIIGMAGIFPGCRDLQGFWDLMAKNQTATTTRCDTSLGQTYYAGFSSDVGKLDHKWFKITELETSSLDPQQAMVLYTAYDCLFSAGYTTSKGAVNCEDWGVFVGISKGGLGGANSNAANQIAKFFNFTGPAMNIDTASSSALSALDVACLNIKIGICNAALVCGVNTLLNPQDFPVPSDSKPVSSGCRVFDESADEYVLGEGCGAVLLMPIGRARRLGRRQLAVIKGTACNNSGLESPADRKMSVQSEVLVTVLEKSRLNPQEVSYFEASAKGSKEDAIEMKLIEDLCTLNLSDIFRRHSLTLGRRRSKNGPNVLVGSVKANIGHLEAASGIAGLIKTIMVLERGEAPGNPCLETLNNTFAHKVEISYPKDLVEVPTVEKGKLLTAVINSFDSTGTNASVVLQQYSYLPHMAGTECWLLLGTGTTELSCNEIVLSLEMQFPIIFNALSTFDNTLTELCGLKSLEVKEGKVKIMRVYYALITQLQMLRVKLSLIGGSDPMGELMALVFAGSIDLTTAIEIATSSALPESFLHKPIQESVIPVYSCVKEEILNKNIFTKGSTRYMIELASQIMESGDISKSQQKPIMLSKEASTPILYITSKEVEECISLSLQELKSTNSARYMRRKYLKLRSTSDEIRAQNDTNRPSRTNENIMAGFYDRFPLRKSMITRERESPCQ